MSLHESYIAIFDAQRWIHPKMTPHGLNSEYMTALTNTPVAIIENSPCPDCQARMFLKVGRFGRYYRCQNYKQGCKGACSAKMDGSYTRKPVHSSLRALRKQIIDLKEQRIQEGLDVIQLLTDAFPGVDLRNSDEAECRETLAFLRTLVPPIVTDSLDQVLGETFDHLAESMKDQYILYTVLEKEHQAGPYTVQEARSHRDDIAGYEGISNVRIVSAADLAKKVRKPKPGVQERKTAMDQILEDDASAGD